MFPSQNFGNLMKSLRSNKICFTIYVYASEFVLCNPFDIKLVRLPQQKRYYENDKQIVEEDTCMRLAKKSPELRIL